MKRLDWKYLPIAAMFMLSTAMAPVFRAQDALSVTRIRTVPPDAYYTVDGKTYTGPSSAIWPDGSKHTIAVITPQNPPGQPKVRYIFSQWQFGGGTITFNPATITGSSAIPEYVGNFTVEYALSLVFFDCPDPAHCASPGSIYVNGAPYNSNADIYLGQGSQAILQAFPNSGYVFVGWQAANGQLITGFQNTVSMNGPTEVYPKFQPARKISIGTIPAGLTVLADRAPVVTPATLDWGMNTTHSLGPVSPQQDINGKYWIFSSWSDGGAANHAYQVGASNSSDAVTATYIPGAAVSIVTQPAGLPLKIDGVSTTLLPLNSQYYTWGVGETHKVEAPLQQTDSQGRIWKFTSWSNGGDAAQQVTVPADADTTGGMKLVANYTQLGKVTLTSSVSGLSLQVDGTACTVPCELVRDMGQKVRISAPANISLSDSSRLDFNGWPGGGTDYTATFTDQAQTLAANYHAMNRFVAASDPPSGASWRIDPASGDGFYSTDTNVAVSLSTQPGFKFRRWDGDLSGTIPSGVVPMTSPRTVRAILDPVPYIAPTGVTNAAGTTPSTSVAAGSIVSIFGANLASGSAAAGDGMLPQTLAGVTTRVSDHLLPLIFASGSQINAVLPNDLTEGSQVLIVSPPGQPDVRTAFTVARNAPGLFANVFHEDGSLVTADSPARVGEVLTVYGTGFGPTDHPRLDGFPIPASPDYLIVDPVDAHVNDATIQIVKSYAAPGKVGIDAISFRLADGAVSGSLKISVNGVESNSITLPVQ